MREDYQKVKQYQHIDREACFTSLRKAILAYFKIKKIQNHKNAERLKEEIANNSDLQQYADALYQLKFWGNKATHSEDLTNKILIKNLKDTTKKQLIAFFFILCERDFIIPYKKKKAEESFEKQKQEYETKLKALDEELIKLNKNLERSSF